MPAIARAFTLIEMLVVLAIISVITAITLSGQATFNSSVLLTDTAYSVALSLRQMQSYGLSSRSFGSSVDSTGYGVHFSKNVPGSYTLFADTNRTGTPLATCPVGVAGAPDAKPGDCVYQSADGLVQTYTFTRGFTITKICGKSGGSTLCSPSSLDSIDIVFVRSNTTDTIITGGRSTGPVALTSAEIDIQPADGSVTRYICVSQVGQVSISYAACP